MTTTNIGDYCERLGQYLKIQLHAKSRDNLHRLYMGRTYDLPEGTFWLSLFGSEIYQCTHPKYSTESTTPRCSAPMHKNK